jgi:hypothetical protein
MVIKTDLFIISISVHQFEERDLWNTDYEGFNVILVGLASGLSSLHTMGRWCWRYMCMMGTKLSAGTQSRKERLILGK